MEHNSSSIEKDFRLQEIDWKLQRFAWILMALFLTYGLLGGFGDSDGLLSRTEHHFESASLKYERYMRVDKSLEMKLIVDKNAPADIKFSINSEYLEKVRIDQIVPEPQQVEVYNNQIIYHIRAEGSGSVLFYLDPMKKGYVELDVSVNDERFKAQQFIFF